jgi:hypothetical protein
MDWQWAVKMGREANVIGIGSQWAVAMGCNAMGCDLQWAAMG